jgi:hypothetical protein
MPSPTHPMVLFRADQRLGVTSAPNASPKVRGALAREALNRMFSQEKITASKRGGHDKSEKTCTLKTSPNLGSQSHQKTGVQIQRQHTNQDGNRDNQT